MPTQVTNVVIPFAILPPQVLLRMAKRASWLGSRVNAFAPGLKDSLRQSHTPIDSRTYSAAAFINSVTIAAVLALLLSIVSILARVNLDVLIATLPAVGFMATFATAMAYPQIVARRRAREIEKDLIPAVRQLVIELRSGVALFQAMVSISDDYGAVSEEFRNVVKRIHGGVSDLDAIAEASSQAASPELRKVLWQISNALKIGTDVATALENLLDELAANRINAIRAYGQELGPFAMIYMLTAVIMPSMGITMLIILLSFLDVPLPPIVLGAILAGLVIFQLFFLNFISSRRPAV
ncbi:MAG TPA: type II secretion system F family protein [Candidatus Norongarragalinales archaeon]|jgi:pilus assembly protein TadC|nr:type II secretion system F family protein [Candidatus Norongarragalinales archaeon]